MADAHGMVPLRWHVARWRADAPGHRGLLWLAVLTLLLCVPLERVGVEIAWSTQASVVVNLGVTLAAIMLGRDAGRADDAEPWLVMQGSSPADWALARWATNLLPLAALSGSWAMLVGIVTSVLQGQGMPWHGTAGLVVHLMLTGVLLTLLLLALGALGVRQTTEGLLLLLILTFTVPLLGERVPTLVRDALQLVLPPLGAIMEMRDAVVAGAWSGALRPLLRFATWSAVTLAIALGAAARRVPERPSRKSSPTA